MNDACCGTSEPLTEEHHDLPPWWRDRALALPAISGVGWTTGLLLGWAGFEVAALVASGLGLAAGARGVWASDC